MNISIATLKVDLKLFKLRLLLGNFWAETLADQDPSTSRLDMLDNLVGRSFDRNLVWG